MKERDKKEETRHTDRKSQGRHTAREIEKKERGWRECVCVCEREIEIGI